MEQKQAFAKARDELAPVRGPGFFRRVTALFQKTPAQRAVAAQHTAARAEAQKTTEKAARVEPAVARSEPVQPAPSHSPEQPHSRSSDEEARAARAARRAAWANDEAKKRSDYLQSILENPGAALEKTHDRSRDRGGRVR